MKKEITTAVFDEQLRVEAYRFEGMRQPFPNHFHEYYVIGFVESGERRLSCRGQEYILRRGQILLFNPGDNHACSQADGGALDYRGLNIKKEEMLNLAEEIAGKRKLPGFSSNVICDEEAVCCLSVLHEQIMEELQEFEKEENLLLLLTLLFQRYGQPFEACISECREEIGKVCEYMERHYQEHLDLNRICRCAGLSKSTLLRAFVRSKGVTPYRYLENIRISAARKFLERGETPLEAAMQAGFSDQSHFTNYFNSFIGMTPGAYREIFRKKNKAGENCHGE